MDTWKTIAALVGAGLGIVNLVRSFASTRPVFYLSAVSAGGRPRIDLAVVNLAQHPLLLRKLTVFPRTILPYDAEENPFDRTGLRRSWLHATKRQFAKIVLAEERYSLYLMDLVRGGWCLIVVRWTQRGAFFPWSVVIGRRAVIRDLCNSVCPEVE